MKSVFSFLLSLLITVGIVAQAGQQYEPTAEENSLLWEISGKGLPSPSYLFGTIHMIGKEDFILTELTKSSFAKTKRVAFEINMEEMTDFSVLMPLMMKAFMINDTTLQDLLTAKEYELVKGHFEKMGMPMVFLERIKPMFLSALTSEDLASYGSSSGEIVSYEMELMKMAKAQEKTVAGLETAEYQMSMFDSIPYKVQANMLVESIRSGKESDDQFDKMVELYKNQDLKGMQDLMQEDTEGIGRYKELLLINRNRNWIPVISKMMTESPTFFAIGAGHLGGQQGVVALLKAEGFTLKPLR